MEQLPFEAPEGLLDVVLVTEKDRYEKENPGVLIPRCVGRVSILELEIMTRKIGMRKNTQVCWICEYCYQLVMIDKNIHNTKSMFGKGCLPHHSPPSELLRNEIM